jgi:hypothetical protein
MNDSPPGSTSNDAEPRHHASGTRADSAEYDIEARSESPEILVKSPKGGVGSQQR